MQEKLELSVERTDEEKDSLKKLIRATRNWTNYLLSKWYVILIFALIGGGLGLVYAISKKTLYTASTSFVLETGNKSSGLGAYAGLAASFGIDLGGSGGGLFEGENILELYRSRHMITQALLSEADFSGKRQLLVDRYIDFNGLRKSWNSTGLKKIHFRSDNKYKDFHIQLLHDSIMGEIVKRIGSANLKVEKRDKKLNIIYIIVTSSDELFAKNFNKYLVQKVNQFYLATKSRKNIENVAILQAKADSVKGNLTGAINKAAVVADATPNQNATRMAQRLVPIQNARIGAEINQEVLSSLLQNLEMSKIALLKETPLIQIVDEPILPLEQRRASKILSILIGGFFLCLVSIGILIIKKIIADALSTSNV